MPEHNLTERARELRRQSTDAERMLWSRLRDRRLHGIKFRRQAQIGQYIVDFLCMERRLIIELDGGHHADQQDSDDARTRAVGVGRVPGTPILEQRGAAAARLRTRSDPAAPR